MIIDNPRNKEEERETKSKGVSRIRLRLFTKEAMGMRTTASHVCTSIAHELALLDGLDVKACLEVTVLPVHDR